MKCPDCGKQNSPNDDFCENCGHSLKKRAKSSNKNWSVWKIIGSILAILLIIKGCSDLGLFGSETSKIEPNSDSETSTTTSPTPSEEGQEPITQQEVQSQSPECIPKWECETWSECSNLGTQTRICTDQNDCQTTKNKPVESQSCTPPCTPKWQCSEWSECGSNSIQTRTCTDINSCNIDLDKPEQIQSCIYTLPQVTPSEIATEWVKATIKGSGSETVFDYLPQSAKSVYSSYDEWNDELYNMKYAWNVQGVYFSFIEVNNEVIQGDTASVDVKYRATGILQKTTTQQYEFFKENNEWKLKEYYELTI